MSDCESTNEGIRYLVVPEIVEINRCMLRLTPGEPFGIRDHHLLASVQQRPGIHRYWSQTEDIFTLAAVLGSGLVQYHVFLNANKRTAADAVNRFLILNGWKLNAPESDVKDMWRDCAKHYYSDEEIADWLAYWSHEFDTSTLND